MTIIYILTKYTVRAADASAYIARIRHTIIRGKQYTCLAMVLENNARAWEDMELGFTMGNIENSILTGKSIPSGKYNYTGSYWGHLKWNGVQKIPNHSDNLQGIVFNPTANDILTLHLTYEVE